MLKFKISFCKQNNFVKFKELSNSYYLLLILNKFHNFSQNTQDYFIKKIFNKINKSALYNLFLRETCLMLTNKTYISLNEFLESFVLLGFVKSATISDDKKIKLILPDNTEIEYANIHKNYESLLTSIGRCHNIISEKLRKVDKKYSVVIVLEDNYYFGKYYHSFIIKDGIIFDYAHNIEIKYESYLKLINPEILVCEDNDIILDNIEKLEHNKSFAESNYVDILKYAMDKQNKIFTN